MENNSKQSVIEKLKKLLNVTEKNGSSQGEIENAAAAVKKLMDEYHLSMDDLKDRDFVDEMCRDSVDSATSRLTTFEGTLAMAVCKIIGSVKCYSNKHTDVVDDEGNVVYDKYGVPLKKAVIFFYGRTSDVQFAHNIYHYLLNKITFNANLLYGTMWRGSGRSYSDGVVSGILNKLRQLNNDPKVDAIVLNKTKEAENWFNKEFNIKLQHKKTKTHIHNPNAYAHGVKDGTNESLTFNRPLGKGNSDSKPRGLLC